MNSNSSKKEPISGWRKRLHEIVYEADTQWGKQFDIFLLVFIILSVLAVMFESVRPINEKWGRELLIAEWFFTIVFTIEYIMRILAVKKPIKYIFSFYGIVDLLSIIPSYAGIFITIISILNRNTIIFCFEAFKAFLKFLAAFKYLTSFRILNTLSSLNDLSVRNC